jgi:hypothetical protein
VVYHGGLPLSSGAVLFSAPASDPLLRVLGEIAADGTFTLRTQKDNMKVDGAPEGDYQVQIMLPHVYEMRGNVQIARKGDPPIMLPHLIRVEAKDNTFCFEIPVQPPGR